MHFPAPHSMHDDGPTPRSPPCRKTRLPNSVPEDRGGLSSQRRTSAMTRTSERAKRRSRGVAVHRAVRRHRHALGDERRELQSAHPLPPNEVPIHRSVPNSSSPTPNTSQPRRTKPPISPPARNFLRRPTNSSSQSRARGQELPQARASRRAPLRCQESFARAHRGAKREEPCHPRAEAVMLVSSNVTHNVEVRSATRLYRGASPRLSGWAADRCMCTAIKNTAVKKTTTQSMAIAGVTFPKYSVP